MTKKTFILFFSLITIFRTPAMHKLTPKLGALLSTAKKSQKNFQKNRFRFQVLSQPLANRPSMHEQVINSMCVESLSRNEFLFAPNFETVAHVTPVVSVAEMLQEKSMYSATPEFAKKHGGPIIQKIISKIPGWYYKKAAELKLYPNIDVRVHDLNTEKIPVGFDLYPAIPGWHADGELRETYFAQPDLNKVPVSFHVVSTISTNQLGVSNTQYLVTPIKMSVNEELPDAALWQNVHKYVESLNNRKYFDTKDGEITMFDARSLHRAMPTKNSGMRLFFRMSMWHKTNLGEGKLSKQEQLYLLPRNRDSEIIKQPDLSTRPSWVIGSFKPTQSIALLAEEQSVIGASLDYISKYGGPISQNLLTKLPIELINDARNKGLKPVLDILVFRLYPGYRPYFVDYNGNPTSVNWHLDADPKSIESQELWLSVSSHEEGVNHTQFEDATLFDGQLLLTSSKKLRRELHASNRGWRYIMRMRFVPMESIENPKIITQQYVNPESEDTGW